LKTACWQASQSLQQRKQFSFASWPFETDVIKKRINHWERIFLFSSLENALFTPSCFFCFFFCFLLKFSLYLNFCRSLKNKITRAKVACLFLTPFVSRAGCCRSFFQRLLVPSYFRFHPPFFIFCFHFPLFFLILEEGEVCSNKEKYE
jgi:hypothetical protein